MTNDEGRKPEGAPERSPKAGEGAPSGVNGNGPKRFSVQRKMAIVARLLRGEPLDLVARQTNVSVARLADWRDRALGGTINPGPNAVRIDKADLDVDTWTLTLSASMPDSSGRKQPFVTTGRLTNLGSWTNRTYSGTYVFGTEKGRFTVTLN